MLETRPRGNFIFSSNDTICDETSNMNLIGKQKEKIFKPLINNYHISSIIFIHCGISGFSHLFSPISVFWKKRRLLTYFLFWISTKIHTNRFLRLISKPQEKTAASLPLEKKRKVSLMEKDVRSEILISANGLFTFRNLVYEWSNFNL